MSLTLEQALDVLAQHELDRATRSGDPPRRRDAFLAAARRDWAANQPDYILLAAAGVQARQQGRRLTGWRWERGTHAGSFVRDPHGTDQPPQGYR